jgi:hypothetical protein
MDKRKFLVPLSKNPGYVPVLLTNLVICTYEAYDKKCSTQGPTENFGLPNELFLISCLNVPDPKIDFLASRGVRISSLRLK